MRPYAEIRYLDRVDPDELVVDSWQKQTSLKLPIAVSYLLDTKVDQTNTALERLGEKRTSRPEMVATVIAMAFRDDVEGLSMEDRILRYRTMTISEMLEPEV